MTERLLSQAEILLENYNAFLEENYTSFIENTGMYNDHQDLLNEMKVKMLAEWEGKPITGLNNRTPAEFFKDIDDFEVLIEIFEHISAKTFDVVPQCLISHMASFGEAVAESFLERIDTDIASKYYFNSEENTNEINKKLELTLSVIQALSMPGFGGIKAIEKLIDFISKCNSKNDLLLEQTSRSLAERAGEAYAEIIKHIKGVEIIGNNEEYLLSAICDIDDKFKNNEIYQCLKSSFLRMPDRMLGAAYLGDYGNPRAIPVLRRYAVENLGICSMDEYYTVLAAIEKLGGIIDDLLPKREDK